MITLLALNDNGAPRFDHQNAAAMAELGNPTFACTPDQFAELIAAAIGRPARDRQRPQPRALTSRFPLRAVGPTRVPPR